MSSGPRLRDMLCVLWSQCEGCVECPLVPVRGMCCVFSGPSVRDVLCVLWSQCKECVVCPLVPV